MLNIIYSFTKHNGKQLIGINNMLPWDKETGKTDMKYYHYKTNNNLLLMGHNTFESYKKYLFANNRPLK